jgi:hypothetical protein
MTENYDPFTYWDFRIVGDGLRETAISAVPLYPKKY